MEALPSACPPDDNDPRAPLGSGDVVVGFEVNIGKCTKSSPCKHYCPCKPGGGRELVKKQNAKQVVRLLHSCNMHKPDHFAHIGQ